MKQQGPLVFLFCFVIIFDVTIAGDVNKAKFDALDADKDGKLSLDEFAEGMFDDLKTGLPILTSNPTLAEFQEFNPGGAEKFAAFDTDGNGRLSVLEAKAVIKDFGSGLFNKVDSNGDSFMTYEEFQAYDRAHK